MESLPAAGPQPTSIPLRTMSDVPPEPTQAVLERFAALFDTLPDEARQRLGPQLAETYDIIAELRDAQASGDATRIAEAAERSVRNVAQTGFVLVAEVVRRLGGRAPMAAVRDRLMELGPIDGSTAMAMIYASIGQGVEPETPRSDILRLTDDESGPRESIESD